PVGPSRAAVDTTSRTTTRCPAPPATPAVPRSSVRPPSERVVARSRLTRRPPVRRAPPPRRHRRRGVVTMTTTSTSRRSCGTEPAVASHGTGRVRRVVTDRRGGVSTGDFDSFNLGDHVGDAPAAVAANRARLARRLGLPTSDVVWMDQVHGTRIARVTRATGGPVPATDG